MSNGKQIVTLFTALAIGAGGCAGMSQISNSGVEVVEWEVRPTDLNQTAIAVTLRIPSDVLFQKEGERYVYESKDLKLIMPDGKTYTAVAIRYFEGAKFERLDKVWTVAPHGPGNGIDGKKPILFVVDDIAIPEQGVMFQCRNLQPVALPLNKRKLGSNGKERG
jgi:hypothetical protein